MLLLAYYGDDFTGSTDVMEALSHAGLRTVVFLEAPSRAQLDAFAGLRAFGVAGSSRTMSPQEMDLQLAPVLEKLRDCGTPLVHYKICSTFDSAPEVGSIGHAMEIGRRLFSGPFIPLLVGAPVLGRYCLFGNLFARAGLDTEPYRLDRHPVMSRHPITPMSESDLRLHLGKQTAAKVELLDILKIESGEAGKHLTSLVEDGAEIILLDVLREAHLSVLGKLIWEAAEKDPPLFAVGSSGVEYALAAHWNEAGRTNSLLKPCDGVSQTLVVSGSCSSVTARQIKQAVEAGFVEIALDPVRLIQAETAAGEITFVTAQALGCLEKGASVILHTCCGPDDLRISSVVSYCNRIQPGLQAADNGNAAGRMLGPRLGEILSRIMERFKLKRVAVAGGDSSGDVARALGMTAFEAISPLAPGSPLCRAYARDKRADGIEIVFKGGQVGHPDFFLRVLRGTATHRKADTPVRPDVGARTRMSALPE